LTHLLRNVQLCANSVRCWVL